MSNQSYGVLDGCRILIAEDEGLIAFELAELVAEAGAMPIGPFPSLDEAIEALNHHGEIDAALVNVRLRRLNAFPLADVLIARMVPFIFVTGSYEEVRERYPGVPFHIKPADTSALVAELAQILRLDRRH